MRLLLPILLAIFACGWCSDLRILGVFPLNGKSHWIMAEALMTNLAKRGHQVDVVTHFLLKNPPPNYNQLSVQGTMQSPVNNLHEINVTRLRDINAKFLTDVVGKNLCDLFEHEQLQNVIKKPKDYYDVVITEVCSNNYNILFRDTIFRFSVCLSNCIEYRKELKRNEFYSKLQEFYLFYSFLFLCYFYRTAIRKKIETFYFVFLNTRDRNSSMKIDSKLAVSRKNVVLDYYLILCNLVSF